MPTPLRPGVIDPSIPSALLFMPRIRALLEEGKQLSPDDYLVKSIVMKANLSSTSGAQLDAYQVPATHNLLITGVRAHFSITAFAGAMSSNGVTLDLLNAWLQNVRAKLSVMSTSQFLVGEKDVGTTDANAGVSLASCAAALNADPFEFGPPHIVEGGDSLILTVSIIRAAVLLDVGAANGLSTFDAGLEIEGILVRK